MRILYATQATGNGHMSRALEVVPCLFKWGEVDVFLSGVEADIKLPYDIKYHKHGASFVFGKNGGIDFWETIKIMRLGRLVYDMARCPINEYDIILNDFEPITAWACKMRKRPIYGLSHQGSFISDKTPRPEKRARFPEFFMRTYAPCSNNIGFHFDTYDTFIHTPIVRQQIRQATITCQDHIVVYLPAYSDKKLIHHFSQVKGVLWKIFSKRSKVQYNIDNVEVHPVDNQKWVDGLASCEAAILGAGFESPSEALFLGKKIMVIPMKQQYEQQCNAVALKEMGVYIVPTIKKNFSEEIKEWLYQVKPIQVDYKDETQEIVDNIFENAK